MFMQCPLCRNPMGLSYPLLTEHLMRNHHLLTSAAVLAANMFANIRANAEVWVILKEFDEKSAAIEHLEKNKIAADVEIRELEKMLAATKTEAFQKNEDQNTKIRKLTCRNASLASEMASSGIELKVLETNLKSEKERVYENAQLKSLTTELLETKENLEGLKRENEINKNNCTKLEDLCITLDDFNEKKCWEASELSKNLEEMKMSKVVEEVRRSKEVADLHKKIMKLRLAVGNKDVNMNNCNWKTLAKDKTKKIEDMKKCFNEEKLCLVKTLRERESEIDKLKNVFRHALKQANFLNIDLMKHQKNLVAHFQTVLKAKQIIRNTSNPVPGIDGSIVKLYEEAVDSAVKSLVMDCFGQRVLKINSEAKSLHDGLRDKTSSEDDDNNNVGL
eukprot:GFUD01042715.1.p1 GENE.GFUD01042715.1~~GFUD01042715.1.p1  ORF type:complete len:406 (+),score=109.95 GFUD01042715.1:46-1218(+)